jgi:3-oxoacyl-[acyl-carrier protein] reductase
MFSLKDRKILITGATGGLGKAIATALHQQGATICITGRNVANLEALKAELGNDRVEIIPSDLSDMTQVENLVPAAEAKMGGLDTIINNAGITKDGLMMRMKDEDFQDVIRMNLENAFRLSRAALKPMGKNRFGRIINISSIVGVTGNPGQTNYCAAKAGLIGMSKALAAEMASRNITVNCIAPGFIATPMTDVLSDDQKQKLLEGIPARRMGDPKDIAAAVVFLASNEAAYVTGQTIHVNGGMAMI